MSVVKHFWNLFQTLLVFIAYVRIEVLANSPPYLVLSERSEIYALPSLPYDYSGLEPYITREMMVAHYEGHHETYRQRMNSVLQEWREDEPLNQLTTQPLGKILTVLDSVPEQFRTRLRNNLGGYANHAIFWAVMSPNVDAVDRRPSDELLKELDSKFGSFDDFKRKFSDAALNLFGSGYVWLVRDISAPTGMQLSITTTINQDCPLSNGLQPILVLDIWEHAYYLKYQFRRAEFINAWWMLVDWNHVEALDQFWKKLIERNFVEHDEL